MINETLKLGLALITGVFIGAIFFGGLWWTVLKVVSTKWSVFWLFSSLLLRTSIALIGFYYISRGNWERLIICLLGFIIARYIVMRLTRTVKPDYFKQEASNAS